MRSLIHPGRRRNAFLFALSLAGVSALVGCGGGSGGPSGGSGGGTPALGANTILYSLTSNGNDDVYRSNTNGGMAVRLTDAAQPDFDAFLARNRQFMIFGSTRDGNDEIYRLNFADSSLQRLTNDATDVGDRSPVVSPDSSRIAWVSERGGAANIWTMDATGANQTQVTTAGGALPTFSPDGTQIAYLNLASNIVVRTLATGAERVIATNLGAGSAIFDLDWSPNGTSLGYVIFPANGNNVIRVFPASATDTTGAITFAGSATSVTSFAWGPDSRQIVFTAVTTPQTNQADVFYASSLTVTTSRQITTGGTAATSVAWAN